MEAYTYVFFSSGFHYLYRYATHTKWDHNEFWRAQGSPI
jgi:hypothetical protein